MLTSLIMHKMNHIQVNLIQVKTFELEVDFAEYSTLMCGLRIFAGPLYTISLVTSYLRLLALNFIFLFHLS